MIENPMVTRAYYSCVAVPGDRLYDYEPFQIEFMSEGPRGGSVWFAIADGEIVGGRTETQFFDGDAVLAHWVTEVGRDVILDRALEYAQSGSVSLIEEEEAV